MRNLWDDLRAWWAPENRTAWLVAGVFYVWLLVLGVALYCTFYRGES